MKCVFARSGGLLVAGVCLAASFAIGCQKNKGVPNNDHSVSVAAAKTVVAEHTTTSAASAARVHEKEVDSHLEARKRSTAKLEAIAAAFRKYWEKYDYLPIGLIDAKTRQVGLSWRVQILPYFDDPDVEALYKEFRLNEPWDSGPNSKLLKRMPDVFKPVRGDAPSGQTYYQGFTRHTTGWKIGDKINDVRPGKYPDTDAIGMFPDARAYFPATKDEQVNMGVPVKNRWSIEGGGIPDGNFHTLLAIEAGESTPWTKPEDIPMDFILGAEMREWKPKTEPKIGGMFNGNFHFVTISGHVHYVERESPRDKLWPFIGPANGLERDYVGLGLEEPK